MMKMYSEVQEQLLYYEREEDVFQVVRCMGDDDKDFYVVRDGEDNPLLMCLEKDPAFQFFFYKCRLAEDKGITAE